MQKYNYTTLISFIIIIYGYINFQENVNKKNENEESKNKIDELRTLLREYTTRDDSDNYEYNIIDDDNKLKKYYDSKWFKDHKAKYSTYPSIFLNNLKLYNHIFYNPYKPEPTIDKPQTTSSSGTSEIIHIG